MPGLLVVDDEADQREVRRLLLKHAGYEVWTAGGVDAALRIAGERRPAAAIMDLRLPGVEDGLRLIRALSANGTRLIVLSGWVSDLEGAPERDLVFRVLAKPVNIQVLLGAVAEAVDMAE